MPLAAIQIYNGINLTYHHVILDLKSAPKALPGARRVEALRKSPPQTQLRRITSGEDRRVPLAAFVRGARRTA